VCTSAVGSDDSVRRSFAHRGNERPVFLDHSGFRDVIAIEQVEHLARLLLDVLERQAIALGVADHHLVQVVDQLAAALDHLSGKLAGQRKASAADARRGVVDRGGDAACCQPVRARKAGEAGADNRHRGAALREQ
jgi:hypothetical protein